LFRVLFLVIAVVLVGLANSPRAWADDAAPVNRWKTTVNLSSDGIAHIEYEFEMDFSKVEGRGPVIAFPERQRTNIEREWLNFGISNIDVSSPSGANSETKISHEDGNVSIRVGEKNTVYHVPQTYRISYDITGLISTNNSQSGLDEFSWNPIAGGKSEIRNFQVMITGPADISKTACWRTRDLKTPCTSSASGTTASYSVDTIPSDEPIQVVAGFPAGTFPGVTQNVTKDPTVVELASEAYSLNPVTGAITAVLGAGAVAGLLAIRSRKARDEVFIDLTPGLAPADGETARVGKRRGKANVAVAFQPPQGTRPGEIGTLMDATANSVDISATIIDLAVRGYLTLAPLPKKGHVLKRTDKSITHELADYERRLLRSIFKAGKSVTLKELRSEQYGDVQGRTKKNLYAQVMSLGWFRDDPRKARNSALALGIVLAVAGLAGSLFLGLVFGWGLIPLPIALFGIGLIFFSRRFGSRTAQGSAVLEQARGFELYLRTAEKDQLKFEEGIDVFSRYLPYAMIFGVAERWTKLFAQLGAEGRYQADTSWYHGTDLYHSTGLFYAGLNSFSQDFSHSLSQATAAATAAQAASSSSSGDSGFSGGGGFSGGSASVGSW